MASNQEKQTLSVGEMFSGPGGIGLALNEARHSKFEFVHKWATDYDQDTCNTYKNNVLKNFPDAQIICKDVRELDISSLPDVDGFLYGFPCNDFSLVGQRKGFNGKYGPLYSYGVEYINKANPKFFLAENVSGLKSSNEGRAFRQIIHDLNHAGKYGYTITVNLYKFEEYGIPQKRHRYILLGMRGDLGLRFMVPKPSYIYKSVKEALADIPRWCTNNELTNQSKRVRDRLAYIKPGENVWQAGARIPPELRLHVKKAWLSQIYRRLDPDEPSYTITGSGGGGTHVYHWDEPRALTNRERARIQTFPDSFTFYGNKESVRKQIGMAVPYEGAKIILEALLKTFNEEGYASVEASNGIYDALSFSI